MKDITKKEMELILTIFKNPKQIYNANSISSKISITSMGALKIMKRLEKQGILISKSMGKAVFYKINFENDYAKDYIFFLLKREAEHTSPYIKRWLNELKKIKNADIIILFGSVLKKENRAYDIDVLIVTKQKNFNNLKKEIEGLNKLNEKKLHPIYQTIADLMDNIKKENKIILNAINGIIIKGNKNIIKILK